MFTRKQYLEGACSHDEYYEQFVTPYYIHFVNIHIGTDRIMASNDPSFNDIPLNEWDAVCNNIMMSGRDRDTFKQLGETYTLGAMICVVKRAALMIKNGQTTIV